MKFTIDQQWCECVIVLSVVAGVSAAFGFYGAILCVLVGALLAAAEE